MPLGNTFHTSGPPQFKPNDISDPLTRILLSPRQNETDAERIVRERGEREARLRSKQIDESLERERAQKERDRKKKKISKIMLLGQSQSGKSTTLKNFQLHFAPAAFEAERGRWKTVIHLNLIRSLRKIHDSLSAYAAAQAAQQASSRASPIGGHTRNNSSFDLYGASILNNNDEDDEEFDIGISAHLRRPKLSAQHRLLLLRLRPLLSLESQLLRTLIPDSREFPGFNFGFDGSPAGLTAWGNEQPDSFSYSSSASRPQSPLHTHPSSFTLDEIAIPISKSPHSGLSTSPLAEGLMAGTGPAGSQSFSRKNTGSFRASPRSPIGRSPLSPLAGPASSPIVMKQIGPFPDSHSGSLSKDTPEFVGRSHAAWDEDAPPRSIATSPTPSGYEPGDDVPERMLATCAPDIVSLWGDAFLRNLLCGPLAMGGLGLKLHEDAGFFLNDVTRITSLNYVPTNDDIVRARLKTMGVSEHRFQLEDSLGMDNDFVAELIVYDVGGARTQRHKWMPFFDDINVVVFLAPISVFDQRLAEDQSVNRLQDSFLLWKEICQTRTLAKADFLLFLNKCDLLHAKLESGMMLKKFIPQYEGENNLRGAVKYFREIFMQIWRKNTDELKKSTKAQRAIYMHSTSMIDIRASKKLITNVQECALRSHLRTAMVI